MSRNTCDIIDEISAVTSCTDFWRFCNDLAIELDKSIDFDRACLAFVDKNRQYFKIIPVTQRMDLYSYPKIPIRKVGFNQVMNPEKAFIARDVEREFQPSKIETFFSKDISSYIAVPLYCENQYIGTFNIGSKKKSVYTVHDLKMSRATTIPH